MGKGLLMENRRKKYYIMLFCFLATTSACRFDPTEKEIITHVPVSFNLDPLTNFSPEDFNLYDQLIESDDGAGSLRIFADNPSSTNFLDVAATSFKVRSANGAEYTFALTGSQIQRQADKVTLNIPNMPVGPGTLGGVLFMTNGGVANNSSDTPATAGQAFTGVWVTAGAGGDVPIDVSSSSLSAQTINVPLIDAAQGGGGPHLARSDVNLVLCYDGSGGASAGSTTGAYTYVSSSLNCGAVIRNAEPVRAPTQVSDMDVYVRVLVAGVYSKWYRTDQTNPIHYLMLGTGTPTVRLQLYCNFTSGCMPSGMNTAGDLWTSCPVTSTGNVLDGYNYGASDILHLWFQRCS